LSVQNFEIFPQNERKRYILAKSKDLSIINCQFLIKNRAARPWNKKTRPLGGAGSKFFTKATTN
jgi:hypothetical protein